MPDWTNERTERLKQLHAEGYSSSQIAADLGGVTRNAVIGKVHRLGLSRPWVKKVRPEKRGKHVRLSALGHSDPAPKPLPKHPDENIPLEQRKQLLQLRARHCKYPIGHPGEPGFFFCGGPVHARSCCVEHFRRCYSKTPVQITHEERMRRHFHALKNIERTKRAGAHT